MNEVLPTHTIGGYVPMVDGPEKVSGRAKYTADIAVAPGTLTGRIFRSPYAHAEIVEVDVSRALKVPGVRAIITGADCDKTFGVLPIARSEHPLARDKVRYRGEPVAAVAAVDDASAKAAIALDHDEGPRTPRILFGSGRARARRGPHSRAQAREHRARGRLSRSAMSRRASPTRDLVEEGEYQCPEVCQNQMETHAAIVGYDAESDRITVHATTQTPYYVHLMMAHVLEMPMAKVRIVKPFIGGGFGCAN